MRRVDDRFRDHQVRLFLLGLLLVFCTAANAQGTSADYERANGLRERFRNKVFRDRVRAHWFDGGNQFWYRNDLPEGGQREFIRVDAALGRQVRAFDHRRMAAALTRTLGRPLSPDKLPIERLEFSDDGAILLLFGADGVWECDLTSYRMSIALKPRRFSGSGYSAIPLSRFFWAAWAGNSLPRGEPSGDVACPLKTNRVPARDRQ